MTTWADAAAAKAERWEAETRPAIPTAETDSAIPSEDERGYDYGPFDSEDDACEANYDRGYAIGYADAVADLRKLLDTNDNP